MLHQVDNEVTNLTKSSKVLLIGSSPLPSPSDFFTTAANALPDGLPHVPDGETGRRSSFIAWQHPILPIDIIQPRWDGQPPTEGSTFRELRTRGVIPAGVRFQMSLPTPLSVVRGSVEDDAV